MFELLPPYTEIDEKTNTDFGFRRHRITGAWLSSSLAVGERTLSGEQFAKYVHSVAQYLHIKGVRPPQYDKVPKWDLLRDYQKAGVRRLVEYTSTLLGDEMGLGKTVQVCI
jgi:hypothetical protein